MANPTPESSRHGIETDRLSRLIPRPAANGRDKHAFDTPMPAALNNRDSRRSLETAPAEEVVAPAAVTQGPAQEADWDELARLRAENAELQEAASRLQQGLQELKQLEESQQKEYDGLLEEKSEVIRSLHRKLQEAQEEVRVAQERHPPATPREEELLALHDELERERRQLKDDEESVMQQMRDMELQMSRERAEMARQRNELQRLHAEIRHELELAARDGTLRERLAPLQRRHHDAMNRRGAAPTPSIADIPPQEAPPAEAQRSKKDSGFFRRLFGKSGS
jgi:DNA repair exonuclease SbcCD ATPase subunit